MSTAFQPRQPRYSLGHRVVVTAPGVYRHRKGIVTEVINPPAGDVYRYRVVFANGALETFFGFELVPDSSD